MKYGCLHLYIYAKLKNKYDLGCGEIEIKRSKVKQTLAWDLHIPSILHNQFLKEMSSLGLVELKDKKNIKILNLSKLPDWFD